MCDSGKFLHESGEFIGLRNVEMNSDFGSFVWLWAELLYEHLGLYIDINIEAAVCMFRNQRFQERSNLMHKKKPSHP